MSIAADNEAQKRTREDDADLDLPSPDAKNIRYDHLFEILDDSDPDPVMHDLDSVMRSFEEEISSSSPAEASSRAELGYLLAASDDDLGLPPSREATEGLDFGEIWGFEEEAAAFGWVDDDAIGGSEYLALDGLFDYSDVGFGSTDKSWRSESMPAQ